MTNRVSRAKLATAACCALVVLLAAGCGSSSDGQAAGSGSGVPDTVTVGIDAPLSGPVAAVGKAVVNGFELYVDDMKSDPAFAHMKVKITTEDDQAQAENAVNAVSKLVSSGVDAIVGPAQSSSVAAALPVGQRAQTPMVSSVASAAPQILAQHNQWMFFATADQAKQAAALAQAISGSGAKTVAILWSNDDYGAGGSKVLTKDLDAANVDVAVSAGYPMTSQDFTAEVAKVRKAQPDAVVIWGRQADSALIVQGLRGFSGKIYGASGLTSPQFAKLAGSEADGVPFPTTFVESAPEAKHFEAAFQKKYGAHPDQFAAQSYAAAQILFAAIKQAHSADGDALRSALASVKLDSTPIGPLSFDGEGNAQVQVKMAQWHDGGVIPFGS